MAVQLQPLDEPLYKEAPVATTAPAPSSTEMAVTRPVPLPASNPNTSISAQEMEALGIHGASDQVSMVGIPRFVLKDRFFIEPQNNDAVQGEEIFVTSVRATPQWVICALDKEGGDTIDNKLDVFYTLNPPTLPDEDRYSNKDQTLVEWKMERRKEGKFIEPEHKTKDNKDANMYYMLSCLLAKDTKDHLAGEEVVMQVMPSSANYRWPRFTDQWKRHAQRLVSSGQATNMAEALFGTVIRLYAGEKVTKNVKKGFYPLEFAVAKAA